MAQKTDKAKSDIISTVIAKITDKLPAQQVDVCAKFIKQFYSTAALDDLQTHSIDDLYGAVLSYWQLFYQRKPGETKIHIYNPEYEKHGWQCTHTIIEIILDDMPFLVDSVRMEINRQHLTMHLMVHMGGLKVCRNSDNQVVDILENGAKSKKDVIVEAPILIEIDRQTEPDVLENLKENILKVFSDVRSAITDWQPMRAKVKEAITELEALASYLDTEELAETKDFLRWIEADHFTFLGVRDYELVNEGDDKILKVIPGTGLGVLSDSSTSKVSRSLASMTPEARRLTLSAQILIISKTNTLSTVHRPIYTDYIGIKRFDKQGNVVGERRIIGLYTSAAYNTSAKHIPFLRRKVSTILNNSQINPQSHAWKVLLNIIETLPRDDLFQGNTDELLDMVMGIFHLQERRRIRLFARKDVYGRFISCLVYVPRDRFNTELRDDMQKILAEAFNAIEVSYATRFSDSVLARIHFVIRIDPNNLVNYDLNDIEKKLIEVGRSWQDELNTAILDVYGEELGNQLFHRYHYAFPASFREYFTARSAVYDIKHLQKISKDNGLEMNLYRPADSASSEFRFKVYQYDDTVALSDVLPLLENMGLRVISERPYEIKFADGARVWINDFGLKYSEQRHLDIDEIKENFQSAFAAIWFEAAESDGFNKLVLAADISWREAIILRAYAKYLRQTGFTFSQDYIEETFATFSELAKMLVQIFHLRHSPVRPNDAEQQIEHLEEKFLKGLDNVANLDQDRILRRYLAVIKATLRTNFYQMDKNHQAKPYVSFKLDSQAIPELPLPLPKYEIFIYSPRFEGVHLRGAKVARGGLRWSDRREDFRTEVLGLMKAQQVKNAVIVPSGAKGGFVPKRLPVNGSREDIMTEVIACYQNFIRGLLDITDNLVAGEVVRPNEVVCYDDEDPYLVVAADKGTATFSDIANEISQSYGFWLGDAFASGGSAGYDHKKMGITAKGAWESVKRHFRGLGVDTQTTDFTVVGIGDMSGDVFGNGMLLSRHIRLVAAYNHMHIFLDPSPDAETSFAERERLFNLPRSNWSDYNEALISKGGGIYSRAAKSIKLSAEVKQLLGLKQDFIVPNELLQAILRAPVDLLWNGGIGTYVKATNETHADVGDRSNDAIRINGTELRCKVVGEGGNLGFTQLARVEYALAGGLIYTDFIDNSAGVDCSDHEVNIKILLNDVVANGDMTLKQRNELLLKMTDEVAALVLSHNYLQTLAISLAAAQGLKNLDLHSRYINELEQMGKLQRELEFLPDEKALMEHKLAGQGLARPSLAILLAYSKILTKEEILQSDVPEDPYVASILEMAFPVPLREKFHKQMEQHSLRREIIATQLSNTMINEMGFTFIYRLSDETGAPTSAVVRAYAVAREAFALRELWMDIESLDNKIDATDQLDMLTLIVRLSRRATRWLLRNRRKHFDISATVEYFSPGIKLLKECIPDVLMEKELAAFTVLEQQYQEKGVSKDIACKLATIHELFPALDIIEAAQELNADIKDVARMYFAIGEKLDITWLRLLVTDHPVENHWEGLSREALRDDLDWQQRLLSVAVLSHELHTEDVLKRLDVWMKRYKKLIKRWQTMLVELRAGTAMNYTMFFVAIRELLDLTQTSSQTRDEKINSKIKSEDNNKKAKPVKKNEESERAA